LDPEDRRSKLLQNISTYIHVVTSQKLEYSLIPALNTSIAEYQQSLAVAVHAVNSYDIPFHRCSFQKWNVC
jgi:hypothetical protein